jgi:transcriptional regulator with XRE-family HTH domain
MARLVSRKEIGNRIRSAREAKGWTCEDLAERIRSDKGTISRIERGEAGLGVERLQEIAATLEIDPGEFFRRSLAVSHA